MKSLAMLFMLIPVPHANASAPWGNCPPVAQSEPIQQEFWKSDPNGSTGPDYVLKSGQTFSNAGNLCRQGKSLTAEAWIKELKSGLNPSKSVSSFKTIQSPLEFLDFLAKNKVEVEDSKRLQNAIDGYLGNHPLPDRNVATSGTPHNPTIIVGASFKEVVIVLTTSDEKDQAATLMKIEKK